MEGYARIEDLEKLKASCVIREDGRVIFSSDYSGIRPLLEFIKSAHTSSGELSLADKAVGKAAAWLILRAGIRQVATPRMSADALSLLHQEDIRCHYVELVPKMLNRSGRGPCIFDETIQGAKTSQEAYLLLAKKMEELRQS
ncbi:DUF1893 domain-containing protein [Proteiniclasticum sp. BAD-10]|uniref:DUF1893 domain-containing protein n=1 Tax=Proteiniclasticum sediminis TaxID=2804028 RepID=A0A941HRT4_9CLOT|nr:DUF1893 domain-containing protein [Proteiniclasticum sediminis]MBR0576582.1 DUF1893 domain-containing protein [Proteiniclasticum sediminis]